MIILLKAVNFEDVTFYKPEFCDCIFKNCEILESEVIKVDFDKTIFRNCQFKQVNFVWSRFADYEFLVIILNNIDFEKTIIRNLKIKNKTSLNLYLNQKFPINFWKSNQPQHIEITNLINF